MQTDLYWFPQIAIGFDPNHKHAKHVQSTWMQKLLQQIWYWLVNIDMIQTFCPKLITGFTGESFYISW